MTTPPRVPAREQDGSTNPEGFLPAYDELANTKVLHCFVCDRYLRIASYRDRVYYYCPEHGEVSERGMVWKP